MKKILFVCEHLPNEGGIGSALLNQIEVLNKRKYDISLCMICNYVDSRVKIPDGVHIIRGSKLMEYHIVNYTKRKNEYFALEKIVMLFMKQVRRIIGFEKYQSFALHDFHINEKFDVAIAYSNDICRDGVPISGGSNFCVLNCVTAKKKIAWIHNEAIHQGFTKEYCLYNFNNYDYVVNVSEGCKMILDEMVPELIDKSKVVYNIIDYERIFRLLKESKPKIMESNSFKIITVARMEEGQKRISRIIECCSLLLNAGYDNFTWFVLGDGPDYQRYVNETKRRNFDKHILFLGHQTNPYVYMKNADIFVLPSLYESFGLVLKEAIAVGCPVIATDFQACHEIINDGINGIVCQNDVEGIFGAVKSVMSDKKLLEKLKTNTQRDGRGLNDTAIMQFESLMED